MTEHETAFSDALARAIAADLRDHGPSEPIARVVLRWFESFDPMYLTVHVLPAGLRADVPPDDAWHPLEWPNVDDELERTDRVVADKDVATTGAALGEIYEAALDEEDPDVEDAASPAIVEAVRRLPAALAAAGVAMDAAFTASAGHFEGYGALDVLRRLSTPDELATLKARGDLPSE